MMHALKLKHTPHTPKAQTQLPTLVAVHPLQHQACVWQLRRPVGQRGVPVGGRVHGLAALFVQDLALEVCALARLEGTLAHCREQAEAQPLHTLLDGTAKAVSNKYCLLST